MQKWKEAARATRKEIRGFLSLCSNSSPPETPAPSCGCSPPSPQILPGHADLGLCCLPGLTTKSPEAAFCGSPQLHLSLSPSPHGQSTDSPLWTFSPGWVYRGKGKSSKQRLSWVLGIMLKLFPPGHPRDLEAHLEVNAALKSVPTLASMSALKCAGFLPLPFQLLKVFLDVWSLKFTPWHTGFYINHDFFHTVQDQSYPELLKQE